MSPPRIPRVDDLVNVLELEEVAKITLPAAVYATIAGSERAAFDRMTLRPRMNVPTLDLDLSIEILGEPHFAPILVGPVADQRRYHAEGELATVRGASAAKAAVILSAGSSVPIAEVAAQARTPLWCAVYADESDAPKQIQQAVAAGCQAICITSGAFRDGRPPAAARVDWNAIDRIRRRLSVPIVIKGVMTTDDATRAVEEGVPAIIVSSHGTTAAGAPAAIEVLPSIVDVVGPKGAVLIDGSFRRGSDIVKALALGARAVLLARPVMWGLAGYGAAGVQSVVEMLQSDLGRHMGAMGAVNLKNLTRDAVRIHRR